MNPDQPPHNPSVVSHEAPASALHRTMDGPPPVASEEDQEEASLAREAAGGEQRSPLGWILTSVLGALLVLLAVSSYFEGGETKVDAVDLAGLRQTLALEEIQSSLAATAGSAAARQSLEASRADALEPLRARLGAQAAKSEEAAFAHAVLAVKSGLKPNAASVKRLEKGKDKGRSAWLAAITQPKLSRDDAKKTAALVKGDDLISDLARRLLQLKAGDKGAMKGLIPQGEVFRLMGFFLALVFALPLGVAALATGASLAFTRRWKTVGLPPGGLTRAGADRLAMRMGTYLAIYFLVGGVAGLALGAVPGLPDAWRMFLTLLTVTLAVIGSLSIRTLGVVDGLKGIMGDMTNLGRKIGIGVAGFFANIPIVMVLAIIVTTISRPVQHLLPTPSHPVNSIVAEGGFFTLVAVFLTAAILAPLVEEITFRGLLAPALTRVWNVVGAILVQGIFFAAIHPQGPLAWPMLASVGCMAAYLSWKEGSLVPAIVMHAVHNAAVLSVGLLVM